MCADNIAKDRASRADDKMELCLILKEHCRECWSTAEGARRRRRSTCSSAPAHLENPPAHLDAQPPPHLHDVHSAALPSIPAAATPAYSSCLLAALNASLRHPDDDQAATLFHGLTRLLLHPPPPDQPRSALPDPLTARCARLKRGEARTLWFAHDWQAARAANLSEVVATIPADRQAHLINTTLSPGG